MLGVLDWGSLKSLVVLNFELEFRSEGICGLDLKDGVDVCEVNLHRQQRTCSGCSCLI